MSPLSDVQFSRFSETEVGKLLTFGSGGLLEALIPMTDDQRVDIETHLKEHFGEIMALQVKASHVLYRHGQVERLQKRFWVKQARLFDDPFFWYFFGFMDIRAMVYRPPVFLVPSHVVHTQAVHHRSGNIITFTFVASMSPDSNDRWRPWACDPSEVAGRVVAFLRAHRSGGRHPLLAATPGTLPAGTIWVGRRAV